jgi:hypothetical protein
MATIICDLDGTLANIDHRLHFLEDKDWPGFFAAVKDDTPNTWCAELLRGMLGIGHKIIFVSGRNETARADTGEWLGKLGFGASDLYMRPKDSRIEDYVFKARVYREHLLHEDILFVLEDRKQVVDMWRKEGLVVLHCEDGEF